MAIPKQNYGSTIASGVQQTSKASIKMTASMFEILSSQIYTDKISAVIREVICNARDAQVEAGEDRPVEVHLPNSLEPWFHVRDFGAGLPEEAVMKLYLEYGHSTKTDSNDVIGMMGIGSKSPLAYSDSFVVESCHEGVMTTYSVYKEEGIPNISKLSQSMTTEPSGLKIKVVTKDGDNGEFYKKLQKFAQFFTYPLHVTGGEKTFETEVKQILDSDDYSTYEVDSWGMKGNVYALMGGVAYAVSRELTSKLERVTQRNVLLMKFNIGDLTVAASRESLSEDEDTVKALNEKVDLILENFYKDMADTIATAKSPAEAVALAIKYDVVKKSYRDKDYRVADGAENITYAGQSIADVVNNSYKLSMRRVSCCASNKEADINANQLVSDTVVHVMVQDTGSGFLKAARGLAKELGENVHLIGDHKLATVQAFFGSAVKQYSAETEKKRLFPKGAKDDSVVSVAKSGLFDTKMHEIKTLDKEATGVAFLFERNTNAMADMPNRVKYAMEHIDKMLPLIRTVEKQPVHANTSFYVVRKSGLAALKRTKIKVVDWKMFATMMKLCYDALDYNLAVRVEAIPYGGRANIVDKGEHSDVYWESIKQDFPMHEGIEKTQNSVGRKTSGYCFLHNLDYRVRDVLISNWNNDVEKVQKKYEAEEEKFKKEHAMFNKMSRWDLTEELVNDLIAFQAFKKQQKEAK